MPRRGQPRGNAKRKDPVVRERDLAIILQGKCQLWSSAQILDELNRVRMEEARQVAEERDLPPEVAEAFVQHSRLTRQTMFQDLRRLKARMRAANAAQGRELFQRQYDRLETMRQTYLILERRAWQELEKSVGSDEKIIDVTPPRAHEKGLVNLATRASSKTPEPGDPAWFAILDRVIWRQVELSEKMFELEALLGLETPPDVAALAALTPEDAQEGFIEHDLRLLYSREARAVKLDPGAFQARFKLLDRWMESKARRSAEGGEEGGESGFRVIGLQVDVEPEPS